jgi:hypothetical protein
VNTERFTDRTGRHWHNKSVIALMNQRAHANETPQETVRRLARELIAEAREVGWDGPPFDPEALADIRGIEVQRATADLRADARILPREDRRLVIEYAPAAPEKRRRFSIGHEIIHTFFPDCFEQVHHRKKPDKFDPVHAELERLCQIGSGELLMPVEDFVRALCGRSPSMHLADELGRHFNVSQEASLRRIVDLTPQSCCLVWFSERLKPTELRMVGPEFDFGFAPTQPKLRVDFQFPSPTWDAFIPTHKSVPDSSMLYAILRGEAYERCVEDWSGLGCGRVQLEAVGSTHADGIERGVIALLESAS